MQNEQTKTLLIDITMGVAVVGVIVFGYFIFRKGSDVVPAVGVPPTETTTQSAVAIGEEVAQMVALLRDLDSSVKNSARIFRLPAFENLEDFSAGVSVEPVGSRENPFVPTSWKLRMKAFEEAVRTGAIKESGGQNILLPQDQGQTKTQSKGSEGSSRKLAPDAL